MSYHGVILSSSFSGNSQPCLSSNPATERHQTFRKIWAVPRKAVKGVLPNIIIIIIIIVVVVVVVI